MTVTQLPDEWGVDDEVALAAGEIEPERPPVIGASFGDARYANAEHTYIDMMLMHPIHGEIPITINEEEYPEVWADVIATGDVASFSPPSDAALREAWRRGASMSRAEFCTALRAAGILNRSEAIAAAKGDWPASFEPMLDNMTEAEADTALILWAAIQTVERNHPLFEQVREFFGITPEQADDLFEYQKWVKEDS